MIFLQKISHKFQTYFQSLDFRQKLADIYLILAAKK